MMTNRETVSAGLCQELQDAYDTYLRNSFTLSPPDRPLLDHWRTKGEQATRIFLGMPLFPVILFRLRNYMLSHRVPLLPYLCELVSNAVWRVHIGHHVEAGPGLLIPHGHIVIDGPVRIGRNCVVNPWVTIGLSRRRHLGGLDRRGPIIGDRVYIGTGAKLLGPITVGDDARIGANAVVIGDVPTGATVVGAPARVVQSAPPEWQPAFESDSR